MTISIIKRCRRIIPVIIIIALTAFSCNRTKNPEITIDELLDHIKYLSSDSLKGRMTGTDGDSLAAEYIRGQFAAYGLVPLSGDGLERFKVNDKVSLGTENSFSVNGTSYTVKMTLPQLLSVKTAR